MAHAKMKNFIQSTLRHQRNVSVTNFLAGSRRNFAAVAAAAAAVDPLPQQQQQSPKYSTDNAYYVPDTPPPPPTPNRAEIKRTPLYELHKKYGAKMVDFAGYSMPIYYKDASIVDSHLWTREHASIFDVSHMQQVAVRGEDRFEFMETITVADMKQLKANTGAYSLMPNDVGGIIDDLILMNCENPQASSWQSTRLARMLSSHPTATRTVASERIDGNCIFLVLNAACAVKDLTHIMNKLEHFHALKSGADVTVEPLEERALIALQGPATEQILLPLLDDADAKRFFQQQFHFMQTSMMTIAGIVACRVTRCGYTGEDGVEISCDQARAQDLVEALLLHNDQNVRLAGLGARDTLRLESGLCLYGQDIDEKTTPVEAGLMWTVSKRRRQAQDFPGAEVIMQQQKEKNHSRRIGIIQPDGDGGKNTPKRAFRAGNRVLSEDGTTIGRVTSGAPSPSLGKNIAMAYIKMLPAVGEEHVTSNIEIGTNLRVQVASSAKSASPSTSAQSQRNSSLLAATVTSLPFVPHRYRLAPKPPAPKKSSA